MAGLAGIFLASVVVATSPSSSSAAPPIPGDDRPNVVVIMTDDQTLEQMQALPMTTDLLGGSGLTFTDAVVSYPMCCPSRATFFTGQYTQNNGVRTNSAADDLNPLPVESSMSTRQPEAWPAFAADAEGRSIAVALRRSGYHTGLLGKYLNGYRPRSPVPPGWVDWRAAAPEGYWDGRLNVNGRLLTLPEGFVTDQYAWVSGSMIDRASASGRPFFLMLNFFNPHGAPGRTGPSFAPRHADLYQGAQAPRTPAFDEANLADKPVWLQANPELSEDAIVRIDEHWRVGLRSLASVDEAVSSIVGRLQDTGELEDTVLVFTSDNGLYFGEHRIPEGKYTPYEPAIHVPLIVAGPAVAPALRGTTSDVAVANVDLGATILDLADAAPLAPLDGRSLVPVLAGEGTDWEPGPGSSSSHPRVVYLMGIGRTVRSPGRPTFSGVRTSDGWVYIRWETPERDVELYNLNTDPYQVDNLAGRPEVQARQSRLERQRRHLVRCAGRSCDVPPYGYLDLPHDNSVPPWLAAARWADRGPVDVAFSDGTFRPRGRAPRSVVMTWLWRQAGSPVASGPSAITDASRALQPALDWAVGTGVLPETMTTFSPARVATRVQWASWLWRRAGRQVVSRSVLPAEVGRRSPHAAAVAWVLTDSDRGGPQRPIAALLDGRFRSGVGLTRADAVIWLRRSAAQTD